MLKLNPNASKTSVNAPVKYEFDSLEVEDLPEVIKEEANAHVVKFRPESTSTWFLLCKKCSKDFTEAELYNHLSLNHEKCRKAINALKSANGKNGLSSKTSHIPYDLSTLYGDGWDKKADEVASDQPTKAEEENIENKVIDVDDTPSYHTLLQDKAKGDKYLSRTPSVAQKIHAWKPYIKLHFRRHWFFMKADSTLYREELIKLFSLTDKDVDIHPNNLFTRLEEKLEAITLISQKLRKKMTGEIEREILKKWKEKYMNKEGDHDAYISSFSAWTELETLDNIFSFMLEYLTTNFRMPESAFKHETYRSDLGDTQIWTIESGYPKVAKFVNVLFRHIKRRSCAPAWLRLPSEAAAKKGKRTASSMLQTDNEAAKDVLLDALLKGDTSIVDGDANVVYADSDGESEDKSTRKATPAGDPALKPTAATSQNQRNVDTVLDLEREYDLQEETILAEPPTKKKKLSE